MLREERPVDPERPQLWPPRLAGPQGGHQSYGCLLAGDLGLELADQGCRREAS